MKGVVGAFAKDPRVLAWDIWNEPDNENHGSYGELEPKNKVELVLALLPQAFAWAREAGAEQPLSSGVWKGDWSTPEKMTPMDRLQIELSDALLFTTTIRRQSWKSGSLAEALQPSADLQRVHGTLVRQLFFGSLLIGKVHNVGMINWGWFRARRRRICRDSWQHPYVDREPSVCSRSLRNDGSRTCRKR